MEENLAERKALFMHRAVWGRKCGSRVILQSNSCFIYHSAQHSAISFYLTQDKNFFVASSFERKVFRVEEKNFASLKPFTSVNYSRFTFLGFAPCNDMHNLCADSHVPLWFETFLEHFLPTLWRGKLVAGVVSRFIYHNKRQQRRNMYTSESRENLLIALHHQDNQSSNDPFIMKRNDSKLRSF